MPNVIGWFTDPANWTGADAVQARLFEHLEISLVSVLAALLIGLPIGLFIGHTGRGVTAAITVSNIGRAIPSYALMGMILPLSLAVTPDYGLWHIPLFVAMTALAIPPILVNAYAGLRSVDRDLIEAARGMGLRERQILAGVELPLAIPIIVGGIRTASLQVIATATIGAIFGGPGLGRYIIDGIANQDPARTASGAILVAALAITVDLGLSQVQRLITPRALRSASIGREPPEVPGGQVGSVARIAGAVAE
jgi:osmoprotectant transport system permease protein